MRINFAFLWHTILLWVCFPVSASVYANTAWNHSKVVGASECGECHEEAVDVWKKTKHQKNFKSLSKNKDAKAIAKKMGIKRIKHPDATCAQCHYTVGTKNGRKKIVSGVSCESCHAPGKDWIDVHNDYGGKGIKKKQESAAHKAARYRKLEQLGMIRPDNIYGWARNCLQCHIVANEKLVNTGGHPAGSDFKLSKRSQGKIRHYDKASVDELRFLNMVSYATELELSLRALASAHGGKYAKTMLQRASKALTNLKTANNSMPNRYAKKIIQIAGKAAFKAGNHKLVASADRIAANTMKMVQQRTGYPYDKAKLKTATIPATKKSSKAHKPKPRTPVTKQAAKSATKVVNKAVDSKTARSASHVGATSNVIPAAPPAEKSQPAPTDTSPALPEQAVETANAATPGLITQFELVTPRDPALCHTLTPWLLGEQIMSESDQPGDQGCFSIKLLPARTAQLYLYAEYTDGRLQQLLPNTCGALNTSFNAVSANQAAYFPKTQNRTAGLVQLKDFPGLNKIYAVLTDSSQAAAQMQQLDERITSICDDKASASSAGGFSSMLDVIRQNSRGHMQWQVRSFRR